MTSLELINYADKKGIYIENSAVPHCDSLAVRIGGDLCAVGINDKNMTESQKKTRLAHEIGHCETGAFYSPYTPLETRARCEFKANRWAARKLLPKNKLKRAMEGGAVEVWQLAEHFGVEENLIRFACNYYFSKEA